MKKLIVLLCAICCCTLSTNGQVKKEVVLQFNIKDFTFNKDDIGQMYITSQTHLVSYGSDIQAPALPLIRVYYLIGENESYKSVSIESDDELISSGVVIAPNPTVVPTNAVLSPKSDTPEADYKENSYPKQQIEYTGTHLMGGFKYLSFIVCPFSYDTSAQRLYLKKNMTLGIETIPTISKNPNVFQTTFKDTNILPTLQNFVVNYDDVEDLYGISDIQKNGENRSSSTDYEYLIITSETLKSAFQPLADWKTMKGIKSKVLTTDSCYQYTGLLPVSKIKHAIYDYYNGTYSGLKYVLLGGDINHVPSRTCNINYLKKNGDVHDQTPTDLFYACFDNDFEWNQDGDREYGELGDNVDLSPEIVVTRVPVNTASEAASFVNRVINYERNPLASNWQKKILMGGHKLSHWNYYLHYSDSELKADSYYSQYIQPYWDGERTKLFNTYSGDSANIFVPDEINGKMAQGFTFADIITHGTFLEWKANQSADNYDTTCTQNLVNSGRTIITTMACNTNAFDYNLCLSEAFIRNSNSGVLGYLGCSREGWFIDSQYLPALGFSFEYNGEFYKKLFTNSNKSFGKAITDAKAQFIGYCSTDSLPYRWIMFGLNPIGDPEMPVYIDTPQKFDNLKIAFSNGTLNVTTGESDCTVCVSGTNYYDVQNGATASFSNVLDGYTVCVTKLGFIPFVATIRDSEYIQNTTLTGNNYFVATDVSAGYDVTTAVPQGNVTISNGNTEIYGTNTVTLKNNVTVQPGATFKITMGNQ